MHLECPVCGFPGVTTWRSWAQQRGYLSGFYTRVEPHQRIVNADAPYWRELEARQLELRVEMCPGSDGPPRVT